MGSEVPSKSSVQAHLKALVLAQCDQDIQDTFGPNYYMLEPLMLQLVRELQRMRLGEEAYERHFHSFRESL